MFKLAVLSVIFAACHSAPAPGFLHGGYGGYALPAATSYTSRIDVHSAPIIKTVAAPILTKTIVETPILTKTILPVASYGYGLGHGYGYGLGHGYGYGYGLESGYGHLGHGYGHY